MKSLIRFESGTFYQLGDGYAIVFETIEPAVFTIAAEYPLNSMLTMWDLVKDGRNVGFFFYTAMKVENKGGVLVTFMESKRGLATEGGLVIRNPEVMVYDFPGCGAMAVSTKVNDQMLSILLEQ
jgi:hypothetical protein